MKYITFALAKGRLAKDAMKMLKEIGITCEEMEDPLHPQAYFCR